MSSKKILLMVTTALLFATVFFGMTSTSMASKVVYHGYVLGGKLPTKEQALHYQKTHKGPEKWRLWVRINAYKQVRYLVAGGDNWRRVWNEDWVIQIIKYESGGRPWVTNGPCIGLMQVNYQLHWPYSVARLKVGPVNIASGARLFANPTSNGGTQPWSVRYLVIVSPYAPRK